jgi:hypothetical protein
MSRKSNSIHIVQYGLGPIGIACARAIAGTPGLRLVGAVDIDPAKQGKTLAGILGLRAGTARSRLGSLRAAATLREALGGRKAHVAMHTTQSSLTAVLPQIQECITAGMSVVSSTEELALPFATEPRAARDLNRFARKHNQAVVGTGVNPGFVMDLVPIVATGACSNVKKIKIRRILDAATRRASFQKKIGVGMAPAEVKKRLKDGSMGHVGLGESALLVAEGCGLEMDEMRENGHPVLATKATPSALGPVKKGQVIGLHQTISGRRGRKEILKLEMLMALGAKNPVDETIIDALPRVHLKFEGGLAGDTATIATLINGIPRALAAPPGLHTLLDLPIPRTWPGPDTL